MTRNWIIRLLQVLKNSDVWHIFPLICFEHQGEQMCVISLCNNLQPYYGFCWHLTCIDVEVWFLRYKDLRQNTMIKLIRKRNYVYTSCNSLSISWWIQQFDSMIKTLMYMLEIDSCIIIIKFVLMYTSLKLFISFTWICNKLCNARCCCFL